MMPPLVLLIMFQVSFSFNLLFANLFANWRLSPEFWSPNIFSTRHGDQNGRSLECCFLVSVLEVALYAGRKYFKAQCLLSKGFAFIIFGNHIIWHYAQSLFMSCLNA